jgi:site-specific DNA recombinase
MSRITDLNVYIYLRKSRKDLEEEKKATEVGETYDTLQRHRKTLLSVAKKERHNILRIYEEVVSGESVTERPEIQEMLRALETSNVDAVLVMDIDRLGRGDMLDQGLLDRAFRYSGAKIITPTEVYDTESETWELVFGIKSIVAREELKAITRRMQRGRVASAGEGKSISKVPPYGYARDENLRLYPDVETAWVVKKMFEMMRDGSGRQTIANELDKLGIKPPNPNRDTWSPSSVTAIIKNEVYLGRIIWGQVSYSKRNGKYVKKKVPRSQWTIKENAHEPIVSQELFDEANRCHTGRHRPSTVPTKKLSNPLAGILKCAVCGYTMWNQPRKDRPSNFLRCATPTCRSVQKGSALHIVEQRIIDGLLELMEDIEIQSEVVAHSDDNDAPYKRILVEKKEKDLGDLIAQKSNLHDLLERGVYDIDTFVERQQNLTERINGLQDEIRNLESEIQKEESRKSDDDEFLPQLRFVLQTYQETNSAERKNVLLKSVLEKVTYLRKKDWINQEEFELDLFTKINR